MSQTLCHRAFYSPCSGWQIDTLYIIHAETMFWDHVRAVYTRQHMLILHSDGSSVNQDIYPWPPSSGIFFSVRVCWMYTEKNVCVTCRQNDTASTWLSGESTFGDNDAQHLSLSTSPGNAAGFTNVDIVVFVFWPQWRGWFYFYSQGTEKGNLLRVLLS